jgi:hypothetical protein
MIVVLLYDEKFHIYSVVNLGDYSLLPVWPIEGREEDRNWVVTVYDG